MSNVTTTVAATMMPSGFLVYPTSANVAVGQQATFRCRHSTANTIGWSVNNVTTLNELSMMNIHISDKDVFPDGSVQNELTFIALSQRNGSVIKCVALFIGDMPPESSPEVVLLIQGPLGPPSNLHVNSTFIIWDRPYSLDLMDVDPDIAYCVEVYDITCRHRALIEDDCNVTESKFSSSNLVPGYVHEIRITPRSNVIGAVNGTSLMVNDTFEFFQNIEQSNSFNIVDNFTVEVNFSLILEFTDTDSRIRPSVYSILLSPSDGLDQNQTLTITNSSTESDGLVVLRATSCLQTKRRWDMVVLAYNCTEDILSHPNELSTHDVQAVVHVNSLGELVVSGYCIEGSTAVGMLVIVYSLIDSSDIYYVPVPCPTGNQGLSDILNFTTTREGHYGVSIFSIEKGRLPFNRSAIRPVNVSTTRRRILSGYGAAGIAVYEMAIMNEKVCLTCRFPDSAMGHCVAVVHQRISQLNSSAGLMNIESSHKFTRSGDTASGCIEGVNLEDYQVGVVGGKLATNADSSPRGPAYIIISAVVGVVAVITASLAIILLLIKRKKTSASTNGNSESTMDIKTDRCAAYEMTSLARQKVRMEENPAYQEIGHYATVNDCH